MTRIILVRHGQTDWNRVEHYRGRVDVPLNETGFAQAEATGWRIKQEWQSDAAAIYSSPLARTMQTAVVIGGHINLPVHSFYGLIDLNMGQWEGLTPIQVCEKWPEMHAAWYSTPQAVSFPGGETLARVRTRTMSGLYELIERHDGRNIILVSHTDVIRVILLSVLGLGNERLWSIRQDNCAINVIEWEESSAEAAVVTMNDTAHLREWAGLMSLVDVAQCDRE